jgi:uncharacterized protein YacL
MGRILLYGSLGFIIFSIVGIFVGDSVYPAINNSSLAIAHRAALESTKIVLLAGLLGALVSSLFAHWMNTRGEQKLEQFSSRPKMIYGIYGAVIGGLIASQLMFFFLPKDLSGLPLLIIAASIFIGGIVGLRIARRFDLSMKPTLVNFWLLIGVVILLTLSLLFVG